MNYTIDFTKHFHFTDPKDMYRIFKGKKAVMNWLMDGMICTEGAERDHFVDMLCQLEEGKKVLVY